MVGRAVLGAIALIGALALPTIATAQSAGVAISPILTIDSDQVFRSTSVGKDITTELEAKLQALVAENRQIEQDLTAEELSLTEQRKTTAPAAFRVLADAFDAKVKKIRAEQDAKQQDLEQQRNAERQSFVDRIAPILSGIARAHGAVAILERRNVLLSADSIDITAEAIQQINAALAAPEAQAPTPSPTPAQTQAPSENGN